MAAATTHAQTGGLGSAAKGNSRPKGMGLPTDQRRARALPVTQRAPKRGVESQAWRKRVCNSDGACAQEAQGKACPFLHACYSCGLEDHPSLDCPDRRQKFPKRSKPRAKGKQQEPTVVLRTGWDMSNCVYRVILMLYGVSGYNATRQIGETGEGTGFYLLPSNGGGMRSYPPGNLAFLCYPPLASYPGLPSQLFSQPWKKAWVRPGSKHHVMLAGAFVTTRVHRFICTRDVFHVAFSRDSSSTVS